jgi:hypothetical protein
MSGQVERRENILRGEGQPARNARKSACKRGHHFTPENTINRADGRRECRACYLGHQAASRAAQRLQGDFPGVRCRGSFTPELPDVPDGVAVFMPSGTSDGLIVFRSSRMAEVVAALAEQMGAA